MFIFWWGQSWEALHPGVKVGAWWSIWRSGRADSAPVLHGSGENPGLCPGPCLVWFPILKCGIFSKSVFLAKRTVVFRLVQMCRARGDSQTFLHPWVLYRRQCWSVRLFIFRLGQRWADLASDLLTMLVGVVQQRGTGADSGCKYLFSPVLPGEDAALHH